MFQSFHHPTLDLLRCDINEDSTPVVASTQRVRIPAGIADHECV